MEGKSQISDFNWAFGLNRLMLQALGIWPMERQSRFYQFRMFLLATLMVVSLFLPQTYALVLIIHDMVAVMSNLLTNCGAIAACLKLVVLWMNKKEIKFIVDHTMADWLQPKPKWIYEIMLRRARVSRIVTLFSYIILASCACSFIVGTIFNVEIRVRNNITEYGNRFLLAQSYYPYDYTPSPIFELTNLSQIIGAFLGITIISAPNIYFEAVAYHLSAQFEILGEKFRKFNFRGDQIERNDLGSKLGILIERHSQLTRIVSELDKIFSPLVISQLVFLYVSTIACGYIVLISVNNQQKLNFFQILTLIGTFSSLIIFVFFDCFFSQCLNTSSLEVYTKIYEGKWRKAVKKNQIDIIFIMMYAQKARPLRAGGYFPLSMGFFCNIVKSIGGYISVLFTVSKT